MTDRRGSVFKWIAYTAAFLIAYFFSAGIFSHFPLMGSVPAIIPVAIAYAAALEGSFPGSVYGLCLGLFGCLAQEGTGASMILCGAVIGMLAGGMKERKRRRLMPGCLLCALGALALTELVQVLLQRLLGGGSLGALARIAFFELLYSMILAVPAYFLFLFVYRRFGNGQ